MKTKFIKLLSACAGVTVLGGAPAVQADVIFDNLSPLGTGNSVNGVGVVQINNESDTESLAQGFTIGATGVSLTSVVLGIDGGTGGIAVELFGPPGLNGGIIESLNGSADPATQNYYTYTPSAPVTLAANTTYYIVAAQTGLGSYTWDTGTSPPSVGIDAGSLSSSLNNSDQVFNVTSPWAVTSPESLQVNGTPLSPVPESRQWPVAGVALLGVVWLVRSRLVATARPPAAINAAGN